MPPKVKVTRQHIIATAMEIVRQSGAQALNARTVAAALECSTQPVFSNFESMEMLKLAVVEKADALCQEYIRREIEQGQYPEYKASGMAYIRFAKEEKELFKLLFMRDRTNEELSPSPDFEESVKLIMETNQVSQEKAMMMHLEMWTCVHGIATMLVTSFFSLDWEFISDMITDIYLGIKARHTSEEN
jgi:AcrR family transcriptional regulator